MGVIYYKNKPYAGGGGGGGSEITVDDALSLTSANPVQNKVLTAKINQKAYIANVKTITLATSGWHTEGSCQFNTVQTTAPFLNDSVTYMVSPKLSSDTDAAKLQIEAYKCLLNGRTEISYGGGITTYDFYCFGDAPSVDLTLNVMFLDSDL